MNDAKKYIETVKEYYSFLITECDLSIINEKIRENGFMIFNMEIKQKLFLFRMRILRIIFR